ncbi:MAG: dienelactone hydrolase, partial [Erythrobacter sp.]
RTPLLLIGGDRDDVVDFERGVKRIFAATRQSDRYLLVYREAAHNIAGNAMTLPAGADFQIIEFLTDPVWRKERIEAINAHFISAFLDLHLKGDAGKRKYLDVPSPLAADGQWPSQFGQQWGGSVAGDNQPDYWRGFQRRWARGLELHHKRAGE